MVEHKQQCQLQSTASQMVEPISSQEHHQQQGVFEPLCFKEHPLYKNHLQEFIQRAHLPLPSYRTVNEQDVRQSPKFRCTVEVDGKSFTSLTTFSTRKAAEQDVAKLALEAISKDAKYCVSRKTTDGGFTPIHEDRVFSKSILHEFATKKNLDKPTYDTAKLESLAPLFVSSVVLDGVKYTGEPSVNKKEAEQLAARSAILSLLANSGSEPLLYDIVKSKVKLISAVHEHCNVNTSGSHLPNPESNADSSAIKEIVRDNVQRTGDILGPVKSEEHQQQSASKKARILNNAAEIRQLNSETLPQTGSIQRCVTLVTLPQPSLLPSTNSHPLPSLLQSNSGSEPLLYDIVKSKVKLISAVHEHCNVNTSGSHLPNPESNADSSAIKEIVRDNVQRTGDILGPVKSEEHQQQSASKKARILNNAAEIRQLNSETLPQTGSIQRCVTLPQPSLLPSTNSRPLPSLLQSTKTFPQPSLLPRTEVLPQPSLLPRTEVLPQPSLFPSTHALPQPSLLASALSLPSLPTNSQEHSHVNLLPCSQTLPQPNCFPTTLTPLVDVQTAPSETTSSSRIKKNKANKKAKNEMQMQTSSFPPSQVHLVP